MSGPHRNDVITYWERGSLVAEFCVGRYSITATGGAAYAARRLTKGARLKIVGETSTRDLIGQLGQSVSLCDPRHPNSFKVYPI